MTTAKKDNPHAWFFTYLETMPGYDADYAKEIRAGIVYDYSKGKTDSLKELYKKHLSIYLKLKKVFDRELFTLKEMRKCLYFKFRDSKYKQFKSINVSGKEIPHYENIRAFCLEKWKKTPEKMTKDELGKYINLVKRWK